MFLTFFNDDRPIVKPHLPCPWPALDRGISLGLGPVFVEIPNNMRTRESPVFAHFVVGGGGVGGGGGGG
jgi:hypothetical protein